MTFKPPFTPIANHGLGIAQSSLESIGAIYPQVGFGQAQLKLWVNIVNGNVVVEDKPLFQKVANGGLVFGYVYNSQASEPAKAWCFSLDKRWKGLPSPSLVADAVVLLEADGHETVYTHCADLNDCYMAPPVGDGRARLTFDKVNQQWHCFHPKTQITEIYNQAGRLEARCDIEQRITRLEYDAHDRLSAVVAPNAVRYEIRYAPSDIAVVRLEQEIAIELQRWHFDGQQRLVKTVESQTGYSIDYTYLGNTSQLLFIDQSDGTRISIDSSDDKVTGIAFGDNDSFTIKGESTVVYTIDYQDNEHPEAADTIVITDGCPLKTKLILDNKQRIICVKQEQGYNVPLMDEESICYKTAYYQYHPEGQLAEITHPNGGKEKFEYDPASGLRALHIAASGQTQRWVFGNEAIGFSPINYVQYSDKTQQHPLITSYIYDSQWKNKQTGLLLRFEISPQGRVKEYRNTDGQGNVNEVVEYLSAYFDSKMCQFGTVPSLDNMVAWAKEQKEISLTHYEYDNYGNLHETKVYSQILSDGKGVEDSGMGHEFHFWNSYGDCIKKQIQQTASYAVSDETQYDGLRRKLVYVDNAGQKTAYHYQDSAATVTVCHPNGQQEAQTFNNAGLLIACKQQAPIEATLQSRQFGYANDSAGRCVVTNLPDGRTVYTLYDSEQRLGFEISASGIVIEHRYNVIKNYHTHIHYAKTIDLQQWLPQDEDLLPSAAVLVDLLKDIREDANNRINYDFFDASERLAYQVDPNGYIVQFFYDNRNNLLGKVAYQHPVRQEELAQLQQGLQIEITFDSLFDRCERHFYDADNYKIADQDAAGYLTEFKRGAGGQIVQQIRYAEPVPIDRFNETIVFPTVRAEDAVYYYFYNNRLQCTLEVDAEGFITEHSYLPCGLIEKTSVREQKVDESWYQNPLLPPIVSPSSEDYSTIFTYDALNRKIRSETSEGLITENSYDAMGNLLMQRHYDAHYPDNKDPSYQRSKQWRYDNWNQKLAAADARIAHLLTLAEGDSAAQAAIWQQKSERFTFDVNGLAVKSSNLLGDTLFYYNEECQLVITVQADGRILEETVNNFGDSVAQRHYANQVPQDKLLLLTGGVLTKDLRAYFDSLQDSYADQLTVKVYDKRSHWIKKIDPQGYSYQQVLNAFGEVIEEYFPLTDAMPMATIYHGYEPRGLEIVTEKKAGNVSIKRKKEYANFFGLESCYIDECGQRWQKCYNRLGKLRQALDPLDKIQESIKYDARQRPLWRCNALGHAIRYHYSQAERSVKTFYPVEGQQETQFLNIFEEPLRIVDAYERTLSLSYEAGGKVAKKQDALGYEEISVYNLLGWLLKKIDKNRIETHYAYNFAGELLQVIADAQDTKRTITYNRDSFGNAAKITDARGIITFQRYNKLNQLISTIKDKDDKQGSGLLLQTCCALNAMGNPVLMMRGDATLPDSYQEAFEYDPFGRLIAKTIDPVSKEHPGALKLVTHWVLDDAGRTLRSIDSKGYITRHFYDEYGRLSLVIDPLGQVTQTIFYPDGKKRWVRHYTNVVAGLKDTMTLGEVLNLLELSVDDAIDYFYYDASGNERFQVNAEGQVVEKRYDFNSRLIADIGYKNPLVNINYQEVATNEIAAAVAALADINQDQAHYYWHDAEGQVRFIVQSQRLASEQPSVGIITEQQFDARGDNIVSIDYALPLHNLADVQNLSLAALTASIKPHQDDHIHLHFYTAFRQRWFTIDPEGYVTRYDYDNNGNLIKTCLFAQAVTHGGSYAQLLEILRSWVPGAHPGDQISETLFDNANRVSQEIDPVRRHVHYERDALDNVVLQIDAANQQHHYQYDRASRKTAYISPPVPRTTVSYYNKRLSATTQVESLVTLYRYDNGNADIIITEAAGTAEETITVALHDGLARSAEVRLLNVPIDDKNLLPDFAKRPEKIVNLESRIVYGIHGKPIVEQNEKGSLCFWVYDRAGRERYYLDAESCLHEKRYDGLGHVVMEIVYATPLALEVERYSRSGISCAVIAAHYQLSSDDQVTIINPNQAGKVLEIIRPGSFFYSPHNDNVSNAEFGFAQAKTRYGYDAFGNIIFESMLSNPNTLVWDERCRFYDRKGNLLADINAEKAVTRFQYDAFDNLIGRYDYYQPLKEAPANLVALDLALKSLVHSKDRWICYEYDGLNREIKSIQKSVTYQQLNLSDQGNPLFETVSADLITQKEYHLVGGLAITTHPDGNKAYRYVDSLGREIACADIARTTFDDKGNPVVLVPLIVYGHNALGDKVSVLRYRLGAQPPEDAQKIPAPIASEDPDNVLCLWQFNNHHQPLWEQNGQDYLIGMSYTATGKLARRWRYDNRQLSIEQMQAEYDKRDSLIKESYFLEGVNQGIKYYQYDAFGNVICQDNGDGKGRCYQKFDALNRCWATNKEKGINLIQLYNLRGYLTGYLRAPSLDLSTIAYGDLKDLLIRTSLAVLYRDEFVVNKEGYEVIKRWAGHVDGDSVSEGKTVYSRDRYGNHLSVCDSQGEMTSYSFNVFDKPEQIIFPMVEAVDVDDSLKNVQPVTRQAFNCKGTSIGTVNANGHVSAQIVNAANQLLYSIRADGSRLQTDVVNGLSQLIRRDKTLQGKIISQRFYYNKQGHVAITIDEEGAATEYRYGVNGKAHLKILYAQKITAALHDNLSLSDIASLIVPTQDDQRSYYWYDAFERLRFEVNTLGQITEHVYDRLGRESRRVTYGNLADPSLLEQFTVEQLAALTAKKVNLAVDRVKAYFHDAVGRKRLTLTVVALDVGGEPQGVLKEYCYDNVGNRIQTINYATPLIQPQQYFLLELEDLLSKLVVDTENDRIKHFQFSPQGKPLFTISAEGLVTRYERNANQYLTRICRFNKRPAADIANRAAVLAEVAAWIPSTDQHDRITVYQYDALGRTIQITDGLIYRETFKLDQVGNIRQHVDKEQHLWVYRYDALERLSQEFSPSVKRFLITLEKDHLVDKEVQVSIEKRFGYDEADNVTTVIEGVGTPELRVRRTLYNAFKKVIGTCQEQVRVDNPDLAASFEVRPEHIKNLTTRTVYNSRRHPIVTQNENGALSFKIYNVQDQVLYEVDALGAVKGYTYAGFYQPVTITHYANRLTLSLNTYAETGLPLATLTAALVSSEEDRIYQTTYNQQGWVLAIIEPEIFYYLPGANEKGEAEYGTAHPVIRKTYNVFGAVVQEASLRSPLQQHWHRSCKWYNKDNALVAEVDAQQALTCYQRNTFGEIVVREEWAKPLSHFPIFNISLKQLLAMIEKYPAKDRRYDYTYDVMGQQCSETRVGIIRQQVKLGEKGIPSVSNIGPLNLSQQKQWSPNGKLAAVIFEDGSIQKFYYDATGLKIAETGIVFESFNFQGGIEKRTPLSNYGYNVHGQLTKIIRYVHGAAAIIANEFPRPQQADDKRDSIELKFYDNRDLLLVKQEAEGVLKGFCYSPTKKVSREFGCLTNWVLKAGTTFGQIRHVDEKRRVFDLLDRPVQEKILRDAVPVEETFCVYNAFGETVGEGENASANIVARCFDKKGHVWRNNLVLQGAYQIVLTNLQGHETVKLSSKQDMSQLTYANLQALFDNSTPDVLERDESRCDALGRVIENRQPAYLENSNNQGQFIPLTVQVNHNNPGMGKHCILWTPPQERNLIAEFFLYPKGQEALKQQRAIHYVDNYCGVDVSELSSDCYEYRIDYYLRAFDIEQKGPLQYTTQGVVQFDTGNAQKSYHCVMTVINNHQLYLGGHTENVTAIELWQADKKIAQLAVIKDAQTNQLWVDLQEQLSGIYTAKPIRGKDNVDGMSLPFVIYTNKASTQPLSRELSVQIQLLTLETHGQFIWQVPTSYRQQPIRVQCQYVDKAQKKQSAKFLINPDTDLGHYTDAEGHELICNAEFATEVDKVEAISFDVQIAADTWLPLMVDAVPLLPTSSAVSVKKGYRQTLYGILPNQEVIIFREQYNRQSGFTLLGVEPVKLADVLQDFAKDEAARNVLAPEIEEALVAGEVLPPDSVWQRLIQRFKRICLGIEESYKQLYQRFSEQTSLSREALLCWLKANGYAQQAEAVMALEEKRRFSETALKAYYSSEKIYSHYISGYRKGLKLGAISALLYAQHQSIKLSLWQQSQPDSKQLCLVGSSSVSSKAIRLPIQMLIRASYRSPAFLIDITNNYKEVLAQEGRVPIYSEEKWILTTVFPSRQIIHINPLPAIDDALAEPEKYSFVYRDTSLGQYARTMSRAFSWVTCETGEGEQKHSQNVGLMLDVTDMVAGIYPYQLQLSAVSVADDVSAQQAFYVGGTELYVSEKPFVSVQMRWVQPIRQHSYDRWNNEVRFVDALGHVTEKMYNDADLLIAAVKPVVDVWLANGNRTEIAPTVIYGYNLRGTGLVKVDENAHVEANIVNAAGKTLLKVMPDGTISAKNVFDALGRIISYWDAAGQYWQQLWDRQNRLLQSLSPAGQVTTYGYNERGLRCFKQDAENRVLRFNQDPLGNISESFLPLGQSTRLQYGRGHHLAELRQGDGNVLKWGRNYFGRVETLTDISGTPYRYDYDSHGRTICLKASGPLKHGDSLRINRRTAYGKTDFGFDRVDYFANVRVPTPNQWLEYRYESGNRLVALEDKASGRRTRYQLDREGRRVQLLVETAEGLLIKKIDSQLDAHGRESLSYDNMMMTQTGFDAVGNRRHVLAKIFARDGKRVLFAQDLWYAYDANNRVTVEGGILKDGIIQVTPQQGVAMTYEKGLRISERTGFEGLLYTTQLIYTPEGLLKETRGGGPYIHTVRDYDKAGRQWRYNWNVMNLVEHWQYYKYNDNGWITSTMAISKTYPSITARQDSETSYNLYTGAGIAKNQITVVWDILNRPTIDRLNRVDVGFNEWQLSVLGGTRANEYGESPYHCVQKLYDANGNISGIIGADRSDNDKQFVRDYVFEVSPEGLILNKQYFMCVVKPVLNEIHIWFEVDKLSYYSSYFYTANGDFLASYNYGINEDDIKDDVAVNDVKVIRVNANYIRHACEESQNAARGYELRAKRMPALMLAGEYSRSVVRDLAQGLLPLSQESYTVQQGDTFASIALKLRQDAGYALLIAAFNHRGANEDPTPGDILKIPAMVPFLNGENTHTAYAQFKALIIGRIYPCLDTPQPPPEDHSFWKTLVLFVVVAVVAVMAPELASFLWEAAGFIKSSIAIDALAAALGDAIVQGVSLALGLQREFDLIQLLESGVLAGVSSVWEIDNAKGLLSLEHLLKVGALNVSVQLTDMALGRKNQFDPSGVLAAMANYIVSQKVKLPALPKAVMDTVSPTLVNQALGHGAVNDTYLLASLAGTLVGTLIGSSVQLSLQQQRDALKTYHKLQEKNDEAVNELYHQPNHETSAYFSVELMDDEQQHYQQQRSSRLQRWQAGQHGVIKPRPKNLFEQSKQSLIQGMKDPSEWLSTTAYQLHATATRRFIPKIQTKQELLLRNIKGAFDELKVIAGKGPALNMHDAKRIRDLELLVVSHCYELAKTSTDLSKLRKLLSLTGKGLGVYTWGSVAYEIYKAPPEERGRVAYEQVAEAVVGNVITFGINGVTAGMTAGVGLVVSVPVSMSVNLAAKPYVIKAADEVYKFVHPHAPQPKGQINQPVYTKREIRAYPKVDYVKKLTNEAIGGLATIGNMSLKDKAITAGEVLLFTSGGTIVRLGLHGVVRALPRVAAQGGRAVEWASQQFKGMRFFDKGVPPNYSANSQVNRLKLSTELALKDAGILDNNGKLTRYAINKSERALKEGAHLNNPSVVKELTKDGSRIEDWEKRASPSIPLRTGQRIQVHFYKNKITEEVNYTHPDFKVKNPVKALTREPSL